MEFESLGLRHIALPLQEPFETSFGKAEEKHMLVLEGKRDGQWFYGETGPIKHPLYSYETIGTAKEAISKYVTMALDHCYSVDQYYELSSYMHGHNFAKAAGEFLLYHIESVESGEPIAELIGGTHSEVRTEATFGITPKDEIVDKIETELDAADHRVKLKIKPGHDIEYVATVRDHFPEIDLMVDANAAYTLDDIDRLRQLDEFDLTMLEQPLGNTDLVNHSVLAGEIETPICLDESIRSADDVDRAARIGACDIINLKPQRVSGLYEAKRINDRCLEHDLDMWVGGVGESGLGMSFALAAGSLEAVSLSCATIPVKEYLAADIVDSSIELTDGRVEIPDEPGLIGAVDRDKLDEYTVDRQELSLDGVEL